MYMQNYVFSFMKMHALNDIKIQIMKELDRFRNMFNLCVCHCGFMIPFLDTFFLTFFIQA